MQRIFSLALGSQRLDAIVIFHTQKAKQHIPDVVYQTQIILILVFDDQQYHLNQ